MLAAHLLGAPRLPRRWLDSDDFAVARALAQDASERYQRTSSQRASLLNQYEPTVLELDLAALHTRFTTQYASVFRYLRPDYWRDVRKIRACQRTGVNRSTAEVAADIRQGHSLLAEERYVHDNVGAYATALGGFFVGVKTDWVQVQQAIAWTDRLYELLGQERPSERIAAFVVEGGSKLQTLRTRWQRLKTILSEWRQEADYLVGLLYLDILPGQSLSLDEVEVTQMRDWLLELLETFRSYWRAANALATWRHTTQSSDQRRWDQLLGDLHLIDELRNLREWFGVRREALAAVIGPRYADVDTDWDAIASSLAWCDEFWAAWGTSTPPDGLIEALSRTGDEPARAAVRAVREEMLRFLDSLDEEWSFCDTILPRGAVAALGLSYSETDLALLAKHLTQLIEDLPRLADWIDFRRYWRACETAGLGSFLAAAQRREPMPVNLLELFQKRFCRLWLDAIYGECPQLAHFRGAAHNQAIQVFRELDMGHIKLARTRLAAAMASQRAAAIRSADIASAFAEPVTRNSSLSAWPGAELTFLRRELGKKRHRSIRRIVQGAGSAILALKPCWMVSPLSVSHYVVPDSVAFDLVIFDEASQICPEDAICSILRSTQVVVVGDPKQLPPSRFFAKSVSDSEAEDGEPQEEVFESILDECAAAMPARSLLWHYRSQHESLIAFSNHYFYDGRLYTFPGPQVEHSNGVRFVYVPEGRYDRGRSRTNPQEAQRVAELVFEHVARYPGRSLGVVAFSEAQQSAIERELEQRRRQQPDFEPYFDENREVPFFVKNLESVQGDERDVIVLSVGYGKDASGRVYQQFGPLNGAGGGRRLNVAITRARQQVLVVSSIRAEELERLGGRSSGARLLHAYLAYAERGPDTLGLSQTQVALPAEDATISFDSPFEEEVYEALTAHGLEMATQVGCSGYRIDLAIRDLRRPGRYVLGVECDGATYHSTPTARDRDRIRQRHLEGLGWHIHRIWSRDWVRDREGEIRKVLDRIKELEMPSTPLSHAIPTVSTLSPQTEHPQVTRIRPAEAPRTAVSMTPITQLRTCESCAHYTVKTSTAFLCLRDATIKRREPNGETPGCPGWKRSTGRAAQ
jgi:very-short-patch-repair endonuclease